jgi:hypothetical protein
MRSRVPAFLLLLMSSLAACAARPVSGVADTKTTIAPARDDAQLRAELRADLAKRRAMHIQRLRAYADAGMFPQNTYSKNAKLNVFIDEQGKLCAAANLIALDGHRDLVDATAQKNNMIRLADVKDGALMDWMLRSGLTQEEIALIQEPYMPYEEEMSEAERQRLKLHFSIVLQQLERDGDKSLDLAVDRLMAASV